MKHLDFASVGKLDIASLRKLLNSGEPVEQIWTAWALGLRLGSTLSPELVGQSKESDDPGVRRHLIIMLAGMGEYEIIQAFASHDTDYMVRATACQYLIQTSRSGDDIKLDFIKTRLFGDAASAVRLTILVHLYERKFKLSDPELMRLADDPDLEVRRCVIDLVVENHLSTDFIHTLVLVRLGLEDDEFTQGFLSDLACGYDLHEQIFALAKRATDRSRRLFLLKALVKSKKRLFGWREIEQLTLDRDNDEITLYLLQLFDTDIVIRTSAEAEDVLGWLLGCAMLFRAHEQTGSPGKRSNKITPEQYLKNRLLSEIRNHARDIIFKLGLNFDQLHFTNANRERLGVLIAEVEAEIEKSKAYYYDDDDEEEETYDFGRDPLSIYKQLLNQCDEI